MAGFIAKIITMIAGYLDLAKVIVSIVEGLFEPVTRFAETLMEAWKKLIDRAGSEEEKEALKIAAHADVVAKTMGEFTSSPTAIEEWLLHVYIKAKVRFWNGGEGKTEYSKSKGVFRQPSNVDEYVKHIDDIFNRK